MPVGLGPEGPSVPEAAGGDRGERPGPWKAARGGGGPLLTSLCPLTGVCQWHSPEAGLRGKRSVWVEDIYLANGKKQGT